MASLNSYLSGNWVSGKGRGAELIDPVKGDVLATASGDGLDLGAALDFARNAGGNALRAMTYGERGAMIRAVADGLAENRKTYYQTALKNSGNTQADAAMDIEGGIFTLKYFASLGKRLGEARHLVEPGFDQLAREPVFQAGHIWTPITGAGIHINAFNFPSWGLWEKAAVSWLSGVAVVAKPATSTALLSYQMVKDVIDAALVPDGALSLICGGGRDLMDHVTGRDAIAFTGSAETAVHLRAARQVISSNVRFTLEADSLNMSMLGPDATPGSAEFDLFVKEIRKEMTQKAGQKCTAIRRILAPEALVDDVAGALEAQLGKVSVGDPRNQTVRMGPLVNKAQQKAALDGIAQLQGETRTIIGGTEPGDLVEADPDTGCFVQPTLLKSDAPNDARLIHEVEVFGPVATLMPYHDADDGFALAARGAGSLAASVFTADDGFAADAAVRLGPSHGRVLVINEAVAEHSTGHGNVMPQCVHGGPGRAGGGEELGGLRGLRFYHQRTAIQADKARLDTLRDIGAEVSL
jgi:3,4-dehydroadipyl-CoA semialdehyde dehydrogenase